MRSKLILIFLLALITIPVAQGYGLEPAYEWPTVKSGQILLVMQDGALPAATLQGNPLRTGRGDLDPLLAQIGAFRLAPIAPKHQPNWFMLSFDPRHSVVSATQLLRMSSAVVEAWPCPLLPMAEMTYTPNDLLLPGQWHLDQIHAPTAWGIYRGSDTVQVGIIDGGVDYTHVDLAPNIWINPGEDLNSNRIIEPGEVDGLDNDANGYVDDFWGWDWIDLDPSEVWPGEDPGPPDNDPSDFDGHGTHCAGDACAASDNFIGVASPGFKSQIMALRAGFLSDSGFGYVDISAAIPAVYYAIDEGAEVISMSFGGSPYYPFEAALQAANDAGLVLVAAAGNESSSDPIYPAGYDFVIGVAATQQGDVLADFSNYGTWITLCTPGVDILSTIIGAWGNMSGTSMATPVTAGVAALVKSLKPEWNSSDVGQWLARTADNIDVQNPSYIGQLGGGRLNAAHAVDLFVTVDSLWGENAAGGARLAFDEEGSLYIRYHKYFGTATNVNLTMSSPNPRVDFTQPAYWVGTISAGGIGVNTDDPFRLTVQNGGPQYEEIELHAQFVGDGFEFTQILHVPVGRGRILIIDADQNQTKQTSTYYEQVLQELGLEYETWRRSERESLGSEIMDYEAIIHFSGTAQSNIFPGNDWNDLDDYLDAGGNLIVSGQNVAQDLSASQPDVLQNILRVQYLAPSSGNMTVKGAPGNPHTEEMELIMVGGGGAWNQNSMDKVSALLGAEPWFVYRTEVPTELAGVRTRIGASDLFFCAFGLESINDSTSTNTRYDVLSLMLNEFGIVPVVEPLPRPLPAEMALLPYPNPFNGEIKIAYDLPQTGALQIRIFNVMGRLVALHRIGHAPAGSGNWLWKAGPQVSSGIYFVSMQAAGHELQRKIVFLK